VSLLSLFRGRQGDARTINDTDIPWISTSTAGSVNEHTALNLSTVWACETLIADSIAGLPIDTYRTSGDERIPTTPPRWVDTPNPDSTPIDFDTQRVLSLLGWGNVWCLLMRRDGSTDPKAPVYERWVIEPWRVQGHRPAGQRVTWTVDGVAMPAASIQHIPGYRLPGQLLGMSVVQHATRSLNVGVQAETLSESMFANGVNPSGVLQVPSMPAEASGDVVDRLREQFAGRYASARNAGKPLVLTGGTTWNQVSINPVDAELLASRMFQVEEICRWFRVPPHEVNHITKNASQGGGNGLEAQSTNLVRRTLMPWIQRLEQADSLLLTRPQKLRYNVAGQLRADLAARYTAYRQGREGGWLSANDVRSLEDMPAIPNGDRYLEPLNYGEAGDVPDAPEPPEGPDGPQ
jgi:HK97 family phage portal protein